MSVKIKKQVVGDWSSSDQDSLYDILSAIRVELDDIRTQYAVVRTLVNELKTDYNLTLAKLDADAGVTDVNYASTNGISSASAAALSSATTEVE